MQALKYCFARKLFMLLSFLLQEPIQMVFLILLDWILHFRKQDCESKIFLFWKNVTSEQNIQHFQGVLLLIFGRGLHYFSCLSYGKLIQSFLFKTTHLNSIHSSNTWLQWIELSLRRSDSVLGFQIQWRTHRLESSVTKNDLQQSKQVSLLIQTFLLQVQLYKSVISVAVFYGHFWWNGNNCSMRMIFLNLLNSFIRFMYKTAYWDLRWLACQVSHAICCISSIWHYSMTQCVLGCLWLHVNTELLN